MGAKQPPQLTILQLISRTYYHLLPVFERYMGISRARWAVLSQLHRCGQMSQATLQKHLQVHGAAITRQVKQLEGEGYVLRWPAPHDNRFTLVDLTPVGKELVEGMMARRKSFEDSVLQGITEEEIAVTMRCLSKIKSNLCECSLNEPHVEPPAARCCAPIGEKPDDG